MCVKKLLDVTVMLLTLQIKIEKIKKKMISKKIKEKTGAKKFKF